MADYLPYVKIFNTELEALEEFNDEEVGRLFRTMLQYMKTGEDPKPRGNERYAWGSIRNQLNAQHEAYQDKVDSMLSARAKRTTSNLVENYKESTSDLVENYKTSTEEKRREEKKGEEKKGDSKRREENTVSALSAPSSFSLDLRNALDEWILYKQEHGVVYQAPGWNALINQLRKEVEEYGDEKVAEVIRYSMRNNYNGIVHDRLKDAPKGKRANADYEQRKTQDADYNDVFLDLNALSKKYELEGQL